MRLFKWLLVLSSVGEMIGIVVRKMLMVEFGCEVPGKMMMALGCEVPLKMS